ncbi:hypothetical protein NA57DRAFT_47933 [Rhizodiscina lignyota]|uniref:Phytanoyl-CoA dioxygenase n=1 Tax=Rhizodiscina lignyota TaxID=1504668 RepID=A0A9P4M1H1_9PEZI|nr:hypothetical protein NA57DRAFT_47933 [Rhizodiscina lignyota]
MNGTHLTNGASNGTTKPLPSRLYSLAEPPSLKEFAAICSQNATSSQYPLASSIESNVVIYNLPQYESLTPERKSALQDEWYSVLLSGPGVLVLKGMFKDKPLIEKVNSAYTKIIEQERQSKKGGDHFAGSGKNDRIWNSFSKHCLVDSSSFLKYYSNPYLALICDAWLGPAYRITTQVNVVKPGGQAQMPHRDYHLGFQTREACAMFPRAMQVASQFLTLQGAVAHTGMPLESGPTRLLPFSQSFEEGFMAYRLPEFKEYFLDHYITLPLEQGDGLFFNHALFHAAGENRTEDFHRSANLMQVSSAFGKPMETIDTLPLIEACWDELVEVYKNQGDSAEVKSFVAAVGEGYPFPTNLDKMPPRMDGMAPASQQEVIAVGLSEGKSKQEIMDELQQMRLNAAQ